jgi:hypothetical protein
VIPSQYGVGEQVWLEATHLKMKHQKTKLAPKRYGPFKIDREISPVAYRLELPAAWGIHPVFHTSLLSPYRKTTSHGPNFSRPPPDLIKGEAEYTVEHILSHRRHGRARTLQYLIKWEEYPDSDNMWEPSTQVHAPELIKAYHLTHPLESIKGQSKDIQVLISQPITPTTSTPLSCRNRTPLSVSTISTRWSRTPHLVLSRLQEPGRAVSRAAISRVVSLSTKPRRGNPCHLAEPSRAVKSAGFLRLFPGSAPKPA